MRNVSATSVIKAAMCVFAGALLLAAFAGTGSGRETSFWVTERDADFRTGTPEHVSVKRPGLVVMAPELDTLFSSDENYFWCLAADKRGNVFAGSGDGGRVYRIDSRGNTELVMDSLDLEVLSVAVDSRGSVYAGTAPAGLIWKKDADGKSAVFFRTGESYVWCLAFDDDGNLYAGTGNKGKIFRVRPDGKGEAFYETGERHVMSAAYADGRLLVGTEGTGLVFAIDRDGRGRVLYDCDEQEVRDIAPAEGGVIYAAAIARTRNVAGPAPEGAFALAVDETQEQKQVSSVYRIAPDGTASKQWTSGRTTVYCVWAATGDSVLFGTGDEGRIFSLGHGELELVDGVADSQVLDLARVGERLVFCTGNKARVFASGPKPSKSGTLVSRPFDTNGVSRWGALAWDAGVPRGASLRLQLRSGNSETPNRTWSDWSKEMTLSGAVPEAPVGRFAQWKATFHPGVSSPTLKRVSLAFTQKNLAPVMAGLRVLPQGIRFTEGGIERVPERVSQTLPGGIKVEYSALKDEAVRAIEGAAWTRSVRTAVWEATDPNNDSQTFSVYYRRPEEKNWTLIADGVDQPIFAWNTSSWPDGTYLIRVVASDLPDNMPSEALSCEVVSLPFDVDNTAPEVSSLKFARTDAGALVSGALSDAMSPVTELNYSLDGGDWTQAQASDGLLDSREEDFSIVLDSLKPGEHTVGIRALDEAGNVGAASIIVER